MTVDYGTDVSWFPDVTPNLSLTSGNRTLAEALYRRLSTPRGWFAWDPDYGLDVRGLVNETLNPNNVSAWQRQIAAECEKDERVLTASVVITQTSQTTVSISIAIEGANGPLTLVLGVSNVGLAMLSFT